MDWNEFLHEAVAEKDADLVRQALAQGTDPNHVSDEDAHTVLFWAVFGGRVEIARLLLDAGAQVAAEAGAEASSLHAAVDDVNLPMVNLLLDHDGTAALDWFDHVDRTPLMIAVEMGSTPIARRLLEAGADVNAHNEPHIGDTALHIAAANGTLEMVKLLLDAGADPTQKGWMWITPLDKAQSRKRGDGPRLYELLEQAARRFLK
jgi:ankyrin repeat protein